MEAAATLQQSMQNPAVHLDLARLATARIFFGHQSVGMDLLEAITWLCASQVGPSPRIEATTGEVAAGTLAHAFMALNGSPDAKLASFERALSEGVARSLDVALLKFCYADLTVDTDPAPLFARYRAVLNGLRRKHEEVVFAHVTVPLTTARDRDSARGAVQAFFGRIPQAVVANARREHFNDLLRRTYGDSGLVFDLARLESTTPDGSRELHRGEGGRLVPALCLEYTDDGGHLNRKAASRIGRALIEFLSGAVRR